MVTHQDELLQTVRSAARDQPLLILAGGSNVVIADDGFPGSVVLLRTAGMRVDRSGDPPEVKLTVEAGQNWDDVVTYTVAEGLTGLECLSGIPGSAGATPIQNVGAYGVEVAEVITSVLVYDRHQDAVRTMTATECGFAYRTSVFKHNPRYVVLSVTFRLRPAGAGAPVVRYAELARALAVRPGDAAPPADVRAAVLRLRAGKGMVLDPDDPDTYSVGSFFTNPVLAAAEFETVRQRAVDLVGAEPSAWPGPDATVKLSAAWLIEKAGFTRGFTGSHPGVAVSGKHSLALTNRGHGTTTALLALARDIRDGVVKAFDVHLQPEPVLVNCAL